MKDELLKEIAELRTRIGVLENKISELPEAITPWEPKAGPWYVSPLGVVEQTESYPERCEFGVERSSKELAENAAIEMRKFNRLLAFRDEFAPGFAPDMGAACFIGFVPHTGLWTVFWSNERYAPLTVLFPKDIAEKAAQMLNSGELVL